MRRLGELVDHLTRPDRPCRANLVFVILMAWSFCGSPHICLTA